MENKTFGWIILILAVIIGIITLVFNYSLTQEAKADCTLEGDTTCVVSKLVREQTILIVIIAIVLFIVGLILILRRNTSHMIVKEHSKTPKLVEVYHLKRREKNIFRIIQQHNAIFEAELYQKTTYGRRKITKIVNRLEKLGLIERKVKGKAKVVIVKD